MTVDFQHWWPVWIPLCGYRCGYLCGYRCGYSCGDLATTRRRAATTSHNDERRRAATTATATTTVGIPVRIEAGTDNDAATTRRDDDDDDDDDAATTRRRRRGDDTAGRRGDDTTTRTECCHRNVATEPCRGGHTTTRPRRPFHDDSRQPPRALTVAAAFSCPQLTLAAAPCSPPASLQCAGPHRSCRCSPSFAAVPQALTGPPASLPHSRCSRPPSRVSGRGAGDRGVRW